MSHDTGQESHFIQKSGSVFLFAKDGNGKPAGNSGREKEAVEIYTVNTGEDANASDDDGKKPAGDSGRTQGAIDLYKGVG